MKKLLLPAVTLLFFTACTHGPKKRLHGTYSNFPYQKDSTFDWQINAEPKNEMLVLGALKAEEKGDTAAIRKYFAEDPVFDTDSMRANISIAQLQKLMVHARMGKTIKTKVEDWRSVSNSDHSQEWVTVWYTQYTTNNSGKTDSLQYADEHKIENGKIVQVRSYIRHFPVSK